MQDFFKTHPNYSRVFENFIKIAKNTSDIKQCDKIIKALINFLNNG